jgi:hypothetical protein
MRIHEQTRQLSPDLMIGTALGGGKRRLPVVNKVLARRQPSDRRRHRIQVTAMQDILMQAPQRRARLHAQLIYRQPTRFSVHRQCVGLPTRAGPPGEVTLLPLGRCRLSPASSGGTPRGPARWGRLVMMGGAIGVPGNALPLSEANVAHDPGGRANSAHRRMDSAPSYHWTSPIRPRSGLSTSSCCASTWRDSRHCVRSARPHGRQ